MAARGSAALVSDSKLVRPACKSPPVLSARVMAEVTLSWPRNPERMRPVAGLFVGLVMRAMV